MYDRVLSHQRLQCESTILGFHHLVAPGGVKMSRRRPLIHSEAAEVAPQAVGTLVTHFSDRCH